MARDFVPIPFPFRGLDEGASRRSQPEGTTPSALNVRGYDPETGRACGAQRCGTSKYLSQRLVGQAQLQYLSHIATSQAIPSNQSMVVRTLTAMGVSSGSIGKFTSSGWTLATGGSGALSAARPVVYGAEVYGKVWLSDGSTYVVWDAATNAVSAWTATEGEMPANGAHKCRLLCNWRSRMVMSGLVGDEQNWFMSCVSDPTNWEYDPDPAVVTQAIAGNLAEAGESPDVVTALVPYSDDLLIFGCDHSLWFLRGDPMEAGRFDLISSSTGMAWGRPYCFDPAGILYFFGSRGGIYRMTPQSVPERMTAGRIDERLSELSLASTVVTMAWSDREQGLYVFLTSLTGGASEHWFYDVRTDAFWPMSYANPLHNPSAVHVFDGDSAGDRAILLGGIDGYVRKIDVEADDDDGQAISSHVFIGPLQGDPPSHASLTEMQAVLASGSDTLGWSIHAGETTQAAVAANASFSGTWVAGRNPSEIRRASGDALFLKLSNATLNRHWALESLVARVRPNSPARQRTRI